jgi:DNA-binding NarL/FixJ family response regulator
MKHGSNIISIQRGSAFLLDPTLTSQESILLRALAAGRTDRQVCRDLRLIPTTFLLMMREMREKTGAADNVSLIEWAKLRMGEVDQRVDASDRCAHQALPKSNRSHLLV